MLLAGILIYGPSAFTMDCTIRNLSPQGARVRILGPAHFADPLILLAPAADEAFEAKISWSQGAELGLSFVRSVDLRAPVSEAEKSARRLWIERRAR